jgi:hypothetical protein
MVVIFSWLCAVAAVVTAVRDLHIVTIPVLASVTTMIPADSGDGTTVETSSSLSGAVPKRGIKAEMKVWNERIAINDISTAGSASAGVGG